MSELLGDKLSLDVGRVEGIEHRIHSQAKMKVGGGDRGRSPCCPFRVQPGVAQPVCAGDRGQRLKALWEVVCFLDCPSE